MQTYTVIVVMEAKQGRENELKNALKEVAEHSRSEATCIRYMLHQDLNNKANFLLYENWESKEAHQLQFEKSYILALAEKMEDLLAKPYEVYFAEDVF